MGVNYKKMADGKVVIDVILDDGKVVKGVANVDKSLGGLGNTAKKGALSVGKIASALGLVYVAKKGIDLVTQSLDGAIDRYDTLNQFPRVMQLMGFDAEESEVAINKLSDGIQGLPTTLDSVASTAQNIAVLTGDLDGAVDTTLALNNAFLASGASSADAERGLQQYVQMLSKGEVDLQSWRTLQETMGVALNKTAEAFGFAGESAQNDLYDALKSGEITFDEFNSKLIELSDETGGFADMAMEASGGIKTSWTNMKTAVVKGLADVIGAIDEALGGTGEIENIIERMKVAFQVAFSWIAENLPVVIGKIIDFKDKMMEWKDAISDVMSNFEPFKKAFINAFDNLLESFGPIWESLKSLFKTLEPILVSIGIVVGSVLVTAFAIFQGTLNAVISALGPFIAALINAVDFVFQFVQFLVAILTLDFPQALEIWNQMTETAIEFFMNLWDGVVNFFSSFVETIVGFFEGLYNILVGNSIIPDMVNAIIEWFFKLFTEGPQIILDMITSIIGFFGDLFTAGVEKVTDLFNSVTRFFGDMKDKAVEKAQEIYTNVTDFFGNMKDKVSDAMSNTKNYISDKWTEAKNKTVELATNIKDSAVNKFNEMKNNVSNKMSGLKTNISNRWNEAKNKTINAVNNIKSAAENKFNQVKDSVSNKMTDVKNKISNKWNEAKTKTVQKTKEIYNEAKKKFTDVKDAASEKFGDVKDAVSDGLTDAVDTAKGFKNKFLNAGKNIVGSIADGIKNGAKKVTEAIGGVVEKARNFLPFSPAKEGPLKDIHRLNFGGTIAESISRGERVARKSMSNLSESLNDEINPTAGFNRLRGIKTSMNHIRPFTGAGGITTHNTNNKTIEINLEYHGNNPDDADDMVNELDRAFANNSNLQALVRGH